MVGQEPVLYARSIGENIRYGLTDCSQEKIQAAAEHANAHRFIAELKDGYETQTGEKGAQLSGMFPCLNCTFCECFRIQEIKITSKCRFVNCKLICM